jgi:hypothetical protein
MNGYEACLAMGQLMIHAEILLALREQRQSIKRKEKVF